MNTIRWRYSPNNPSVVQSNARINRWDDGSLTLQFASHPLDQYELVPKSLAMPQVNPDTPTPTQVILPNYPANHQLKYDPLMDSHTYMAAPNEHETLIRHTNHITTSLTLNSEEQQDDAVQRLQESMVALKKGNKNADGGLEVISITEDPELAKKRAELAEKEKNAAQRKLQAQQEKAEGRANNILRRSGLRTGMGGLTVGGLEDEDGMGATRGRVPKTKAKKARRRNSEYSDDEEDLGRGRTREDEYDEDDGFLVGSDEELEVGEDVDEEEDDEDMDAEGDEDEDAAMEAREKPKNGEVAAPTVSGRSKKRVIEDEDDE